MNLSNVDATAYRLSSMAMQVVARHPGIGQANHDTLESIVHAMRKSAPRIIDQMLDDMRDAPWTSQVAFSAAALEIAQAGLAVLRNN